MSSSKHSIIVALSVALFFLALTYLICLNIAYKVFDISWLSNNFLLTSLGGIFASAFVVLLCEIQKYTMSKTSIEQSLYCNAIFLFSQIVVMQNILNKCFKYPEAKIVYGALNDCTQKSLEVTQNIVIYDYNPFRKKSSILLKALCAFREQEKQIRDILNECHCYYDLAYNNSVISHMENSEAPDVYGKDDIIQGVSRALLARTGILKNICDALLIGIDYKGKHQWNTKKQGIDFESIDSIRALDLEEYIKKYSASE